MTEYRSFEVELKNYHSELIKVSLLLVAICVLSAVLGAWKSQFTIIWLATTASLIANLIQAAKRHNGVETKITLFLYVLCCSIVPLGGLITGKIGLIGPAITIAVFLFFGVFNIYVYHGPQKDDKVGRFVEVVAYPIHLLFQYAISKRPDIEGYRGYYEDYYRDDINSLY